MSSYEDRDLAALEQVEDLLEVYADARLAPSTPVLRRIRASVMAQAHAAERARFEALAPAPARVQLPRLALPRRAFALGMAATLTLGTTAAVLAAPPGSPFYNARMVIEAALLPTDVDARLAAYFQRLDARVAEAEAAAASGDDAALTAALAAYQTDVDAAVAAVGSDPERLARLEWVLAKHVAKLQALAAKLAALPADEHAVENAVEHAIDASEKAAKEIKETKAQNARPSIPPGLETRPPNRP